MNGEKQMSKSLKQYSKKYYRGKSISNRRPSMTTGTRSAKNIRMKISNKPPKLLTNDSDSSQLERG